MAFYLSSLWGKFPINLYKEISETSFEGNISGPVKSNNLTLSKSMEKLEFPETQHDNLRIFEMRGSFMDSGGKDRISDGDIIHGLPVPGSHWTIDFLDKKLPHYIIRSGRSHTVCVIRGYDPETSCFRVSGLNPDKTRFPNFDIYLDEISEMHYVKTVVLECGNEQQDRLSSVASEIADALDEFFTEHPDPSETESMLWRMFFHASLYDQERNGAAAFFEEYGRVKESLEKLVRTLHSGYIEGCAA